MKPGTLYGIGIGPGDPELITLKGARLIGACQHLFVPKARTAAESVALAIARPLVGPEARIEELLFPMTADRGELAEKWDAAAGRVAAVLESGEDACFLTLGDPLLYSTYIYLVRALRKRLADLDIITVPGIMAFGAAAALTAFPVGEGREPVTIVPAADDLAAVRRALAAGGTIVLMKIGKRLPEVLDLLESGGLLGKSVFVSRATMADQRIETDLRRLKAEGPEAGYLSIILVHAGQRDQGIEGRSLIIRPEEARDAEAIEKITCAAFINHPHSRQTEPLIIRTLRKAGALAVSLVAEADGALVGHIAFSEVAISGGERAWFGLGPLSVRPDIQRRGIGRALMEAGLSAIRALGARGCVLVGDPEFYRRFGFTQAGPLVLEGLAPEYSPYFLALLFADRVPQGTVSFHPAFSVEPDPPVPSPQQEEKP
jgi:precorrin-2/cobalt-factor-2 C20-methyltransferase